LPQVPMVPTGGVNLETAADFIRAGADALGIGGELISAAACKSGNLSVITEAARLYVDIVQEARRQTISDDSTIPTCAFAILAQPMA
jgi:2-dehydro-3-deoxyphosphogluconate aldolase/(4S)-4-hydroxy-2-oxoglutarate aldolase